MKKRRVTQGKDFDLTNVKIGGQTKKPRVGSGKDFGITRVKIEADEKKMAASDRQLIVKTVVFLVTVFLLGSAAYGLYEGNFGALKGVWGEVSVIILLIIAFYFGKKSGKDE